MSQNVAGKVCNDFFIDILNIDLAEKVETYLSKSTFKFGGGRMLRHYKILKSQFFKQIKL